MEVKSKVSKEIDSMRDRILGISHYLYENPENPLQEFKACELLTQELARDGFRVKKGVAGMPTAFKATFDGRKSGPTIALCAEHDAIPEMGHICGHNIIAGAAVGAGLGLCKVMPELAGQIVVFGTPAEEGIVENGGGKVRMLDDFRKVDAAMMIHPSDRNAVMYQSNNRAPFEFKFTGKATGGAYPGEGVNALSAVIIFWSTVNALRQTLSAWNANISGVITNGGVVSSVIPEEAVTALEIMCPDPIHFSKAIEKVKNCARGVSLAMGTEVEIRKYSNTYVNMLPNLTLGKIFEKNFEKLGATVDREDLTKGETIWALPSTDFGNVSRVTPSVYGLVAIAPRGTTWHTLDSLKASASKKGDEGAITGAKALAMTAIDLLVSPTLFRKVKKEFARSKLKPYSRSMIEGKL